MHNVKQFSPGPGIPRVRRVVIAGVGHIMYFEKLAEFGRLAVSFISRTAMERKVAQCARSLVNTRKTLSFAARITVTRTRILSMALLLPAANALAQTSDAKVNILARFDLRCRRAVGFSANRRGPPSVPTCRIRFGSVAPAVSTASKSRPIEKTGPLDSASNSRWDSEK